MESRDPQAGKPNQIEVLMEIELEHPTRPNEVLESLHLKGFDVYFVLLKSEKNSNLGPRNLKNSKPQRCC
jgi:hypothetical protein